jgi:hypothetical protein
MKKYLLIGPGIVAGVRERHAVDIKNAIDWVEDPEKATADYEAAAKATQERLADLGINTELVELADSKWVICKEG